jgi:hypothetical protein
MIRSAITATAAIFLAQGLARADLHIGAVTVDITPEHPVGLDGQRAIRISKTPETPIVAAVLALESTTGARDHAVIVSCDLVAIREGVLDQVRAHLGSRAAGLDLMKVFLCATHTHTAPVTTDGKYALPEDGSVMKPSEYTAWMTARIADGIVEAWEKRAPGSAAWGYSTAVIAHNRRPFYADGKAVMYGKTDSPNFRGIEGHEDHSVNVLYFWDKADRIIATAINVPCPSQQVESGRSVHADFWHPVRETLRQKHGGQLHVLAWTGAGGDVTSRPIVDRAAEERMRKLRGDIPRIDEVAALIVRAWEEALEGARQDKQGDPALAHTVKTIQLPYRKVTILERAEAMTEAAKFKDDPAQRWNHGWNQRVVDRFEAQKNGTQEPYDMELHALRLGDCAIASNPFELYTDFGIQMKARSPAVQTFVIQLAGPGTYLPTERAVRHGGYGAVIQSSQIGPEGGQVLVEETLAALRNLWEPQ